MRVLTQLVMFTAHILAAITGNCSILRTADAILGNHSEGERSTALHLPHILETG
jgi:hypothetical protein